MSNSIHFIAFRKVAISMVGHFFAWKRHVAVILLLAAGAAVATATGKVCKNLNEGDCQIFDGDLAIGNSTPSNQFVKLQEINGQLTIYGTDYEFLDFPELVKISARRAPALRVKYNANLKSLEMLNLTDVTVADGSQPIFEFEANPRLSMTSSLAQFQLNIICKNETTAACYYAQPTPPKTSSAIEIEAGNYWGLLATALCGALLTIVTGAAMDILQRKQVAEVRKQEKELIGKKKQLEEERERMRDETEAVDELLRRQTLEQFHSYWKATNGEKSHAEMLQMIRSPRIIRIPLD